ncbi:MAG: hypothetical protein M3N46_01315, partial [Actinomycetota bacterium]|nr:hypothetical protein [Actinomycetota bacterium]
MRWDDLFDDLESQLEQELGAEDVDLLAEEERLRLGRLTLRDRLLAMTRLGAGAGGPGEELRLDLRDGQLLSVAVGSIGRDWLVGDLRGPRRGSCLVPLGGIASVLPTLGQLGRSVDGEDASEAPVHLSARLGLSFVLRDLCRRRAALELSTASGERMHGTIDRVGRDHLDLAEHEVGVPRRAALVTRIRMLPLEQLV